MGVCAEGADYKGNYCKDHDVVLFLKKKIKKKTLECKNTFLTLTIFNKVLSSLWKKCHFFSTGLDRTARHRCVVRRRGRTSSEGDCNQLRLLFGLVLGLIISVVSFTGFNLDSISGSL